MTTQSVSSVFKPKTASPAIRRIDISDRLFSDGLQALLVRTEDLANLAISYYLQLANSSHWVSDATLFSNFSVELKDQCATLRYAIQSGQTRLNSGLAANRPVWKPETQQAVLEREHLLVQTEQLMDLYSWLQPQSLLRSDRAQSYYLLAQHLAALSEHFSLLGEIHA